MNILMRWNSENQHSELCDKAPGDLQPSNKDSILTDVFHLTKENMELHILEKLLAIKKSIRRFN